MSLDAMRAAEDRLQELAPLIAKELGYSVVPRDADVRHYVELTRPSGERLGLSVARHSGSGYDKLHVQGRFDGYVGGKQVWWHSSREKNPSASMSLAKTPQVIAADIQRRVLPGYLTLLKQCQEAVERYKRESASAARVAAELAELVGCQVSTREPARPALNLYQSTKLSGNSATVVVSDTTVRFDHLEVSPKVARAILKALMADAEKNQGE